MEFRNLQPSQCSCKVAGPAGLAFTPGEACPAFPASPGPSQMAPPHEVTSSVVDVPGCGKAEMQMADASDPAGLATPPQKERKRARAQRKDTGAEKIKNEEEACAGESSAYLRPW